jgi:hypothetical protein
MGAEGKYDLKLAAGYDTSSTSEPVAPGTSVVTGKSAVGSAGKISIIFQSSAAFDKNEFVIVLGIVCGYLSLMLH